MGCGGCAKAKRRMAKLLEEKEKAKGEELTRAEKRNIRIAERKARIARRNARILKQREASKK